MKTCLLLLPGMLNDAGVWREVIGAIAPEIDGGARVDIRIATLTEGGGIEDMARAAWTLLEDLDPADRLVVCGFSMGGYVAIAMVAKPARRVDALLLLDTSARPESADGRVTREKTIAALETDFERTVDGILAFGTDRSNRDRPGLMARAREMMLQVGAPGAIAQNRAIADRPDHRAALATLATPTVVACGRNDRITPPALSEELARLVPGASLQWIEDAGHMTPLEQPQAVAAIIRAMLPPTPGMPVG